MSIFTIVKAAKANGSNDKYPFGCDPDGLAGVLEEFATQLRSGKIVPQGVILSEKIQVIDYFIHELTITFVEVEK